MTTVDSTGTKTIPVRWTRCNYGGERPWLVCRCNRKAAKLYYAGQDCHGGQWVCRSCGNLDYMTQHEGAEWSRYQIKAEKILRRLGGSWADDEWPARPKYMKRAKYARLIAMADYYTQASSGPWLQYVTRASGMDFASISAPKQ